ncbi:hypothetical protein CsSME_00000546 [Camellia sinensis var. sinensis]|uniref:OTU domain-containing protein DDB_G0284757 n=1 Tax=Camellia sinensis TaxID=4442 RepID=UPI001036BBA9|nr:OTU domain-containing protein DDB_G0284757 [Camellia sinensis]XP_028086080.1 OTU domain-containing protein DDB_G0284757 [Camellia sinensis]XP_028086081.1 OTU domain-containing protein DDB_G0284757 [Camellia sinensis]XP_028086082.1 OTU domain-containing protein DDB_G0284757 [Camellia sinensis]XP_028086083.1 OTU domain-containing protein DDB_G0284757 [Camellia sinensis]XP_028086084.1 OTU domain-containing protein DDB_G0284757 [Camellia sinensis]XP_028086085.1 OTU domain-containing protein DD
MIMYEQDPDVVRWGLHLLDGCSVSTDGSPGSIVHYDKDLSQVEYVKEGFCETKHNEVENDEIIARAFQEELSRLAAVEASASSQAGEDHLQASILAQDWRGPSKRHCSFEDGNNQRDADERGKYSSCSSTEEKSLGLEDQSCSPEIADESTLDGEVGKRLNQMVPIPHVPKINGEIPSVDEETTDHQRLLERLLLYELVELKVQGDGNCQFRALSDQIYRTTEHHKFVREQVVGQLKSHPELYEGYVPMAYNDYLKHISKTGEWGDHVTLQAAADAYGVKIFIITSFKDTCYIEILPHTQKSKRIICLSFWAEVHYNSIYPEGDLPALEMKKKKKWWML